MHQNVPPLFLWSLSLRLRAIIRMLACQAQTAPACTPGPWHPLAAT